MTATVYQTLQEITPVIPLYLHVVRGAEAAAIIDAGLPQSRAILDDLIDDVAGEIPLRYACNTHPHHDHIGNLGYVRTSRGALVVAAAAGRTWITDPEHNLAEFAFHHPHILAETPELHSELDPTFDGPAPVDILVDESIALDLGGGVELEAFRVDGHLHAELAWFERSTRCLILGDAVTATSWPIFHGHVDPVAMRASLHRLVDFVRERDVAMVAMSHYAPRTGESFLALVDEVERDLDRIGSLVRSQVGDTPVSLAEAWQGVCAAAGKDPEFRSLAMVAAHLEQLEADGVVRRVGPETYINVPVHERTTQ